MVQSIYVSIRILHLLVIQVLTLILLTGNSLFRVVLLDLLVILGGLVILVLQEILDLLEILVILDILVILAL